MLKHAVTAGGHCADPRGGRVLVRAPYATLPQRLPNGSTPRPNPYGLGAAALSASKHSLGERSSSLGARLPVRPPVPVTPLHAFPGPVRPGLTEALTSLGLLCLVSLLLALLSLIFMLRISPEVGADPRDLLRLDQASVVSPEEYVLVYEVTLALCAFSLSLNLCCLLVCSVQFLFSVKLVRDSPDGERTNKFLKKSALTRVCAVGGFFVSIPVFLTGIILYTFIQFHSTPAIVTSILIGVGIMFCGCAMVHNVFLWQKEKTNAVRALAQQQRSVLQSREQSLSEQSRVLHQLSLQHQRSSLSPQPTHPSSVLESPTPPEICTLV